MSAPVMVMSTSRTDQNHYFDLDSTPIPILTAMFLFTDAPSAQRQSGRKAQVSNITAAKTVADVIRTCLGPKAMLKMVRSL